MNIFSNFLHEKATVVGKMDMSKFRKVVFDKPSGTTSRNYSPKQNSADYVTQKDLNALEKILDRLFAHYNIDITFTKHFKDRINDARNQKQITIDELRNLFQKAYHKVGDKFPKMKGLEAVLFDIQTKINVPFVLKPDKGGGLELVSKTIMRKPNFQTSNQKIRVEQTMNIFESILSESASSSKEDNIDENKAAKKYMHDPLYKAVLTSKSKEEFEKAMSNLIAIRGNEAVKIFQNALKNNESYEEMNEEKSLTVIDLSNYESVALSAARKVFGSKANFDMYRKGDRFVIELKGKTEVKIDNKDIDLLLKYHFDHFSMLGGTLKLYFKY